MGIKRLEIRQRSARFTCNVLGVILEEEKVKRDKSKQLEID